MKCMTREQALELAESHWWEYSSHREIAEFQMEADRLCCPYGVFHEAVKKALGRPVFTHEFALNHDDIVAELRGERPPPTLEQIIGLIPEEKRTVLSFAPQQTEGDG